MVTTVSAGQTLSGAVFSAFTSAEVLRGGTLEASTVLNGATVVDERGGKLSGLVDSGFVLVSGVAHDLTIVAGGTADIVGAGEATQDTVGFGGVEIASAGSGLIGAIRTTVSNGGLQIAEAASGTTVSSGGELLDVNSVLAVKVLSGGQAVVSTGALTGQIEAGGTLVVGPLPGAAGFVDSLGGLTAQSGATVVLLGGAAVTGLTARAGATVEHRRAGLFATNGAADRLISTANRFAGLGLGGGESLFVYSGGSAKDIAVGSGALLTVASGGLAQGGTVSAGGTEVVSSYGTASGAAIGSGGVQTLIAAGSAFGTRVDAGGEQIVRGSAGDTTLHGGLLVDSGAVSSATVDSGGVLAMALAQLTSAGFNGATADDIDVRRGGLLLATLPASFGGVTIEAGGTFATMSGGSGVTVTAGGTLLILGDDTGGGATLQSGAVEQRAATWIVSGTDTGPGAIALVAAGQTLAGGTIGMFGTETVDGGAAVRASILAGGLQTIIAGSAVDTTLNGGFQLVGLGALASATTIGSGGYQQVSGSALNTVIEFGGTQAAGAATSDTVLSGGWLFADSQFSDPAETTLATGGTIDARYFVYANGGVARIGAGDTLTISEGGHVYSLTMAGSYTHEVFHLAADSRGGTLITVSAAATASASAVAGGELLQRAAMPTAATATPAAGEAGARLEPGPAADLQGLVLPHLQ